MQVTYRIFSAYCKPVNSGYYNIGVVYAYIFCENIRSYFSFEVTTMLNSINCTVHDIFFLHKRICISHSFIESIFIASLFCHLHLLLFCIHAYIKHRRFIFMIIFTLYHFPSITFSSQYHKSYVYACVCAHLWCHIPLTLNGPIRSLKLSFGRDWASSSANKRLHTLWFSLSPLTQQPMTSPKADKLTNEGGAAIFTGQWKRVIRWLWILLRQIGPKLLPREPLRSTDWPYTKYTCSKLAFSK